MCFLKENNFSLQWPQLQNQHWKISPGLLPTVFELRMMFLYFNETVFIAHQEDSGYQLSSPLAVQCKYHMQSFYSLANASPAGSKIWEILIFNLLSTPKQYFYETDMVIDFPFPLFWGVLPKISSMSIKTNPQSTNHTMLKCVQFSLSLRLSQEGLDINI